MEKRCSSKMSVDFQRTTGHYIQKDSTLQNILVTLSVADAAHTSGMNLDW
jgi:hypothetical protein